jgi:predicted regulator of Ras-like GTPase activity (Roadblock/LC7/MglB family)
VPNAVAVTRDTGQVSNPQAVIDRIVQDFVERTAHVRGAVFGSAAGHPLASCLGDLATEAPTVAAMGAAMSGLATQLVRTASDAVAADVHVGGADTQIWVLDAGRAATLTVVAAAHGDPTVIADAAQRCVTHLVAALTSDS